MIMKRVLSVAAIIAAASIGGLPLTASAAHQTQTLNYHTAITAQYGSPAPYTGTLRLNIFSDGIVQGYYFSDDQSQSYVPVTGGTNGSSIWLDIGRNHVTHVEGQIRNGSIVGTALVGTDENVPYNFVATIAS